MFKSDAKVAERRQTSINIDPNLECSSGIIPLDYRSKKYFQLPWYKCTCNQRIRIILAPGLQYPSLKYGKSKEINEASHQIPAKS